MKKIYLLAIAAVLSFNISKANASAMDDAILSVQQQWAVVKYKTPQNQQKEAAANLTKKAQEVVAANPNKAEPLIWEAISLSTEAGIEKGMGALKKVKKARESLLKAEKINPAALNGSIYTSLGTLYYRVPGWPIGFGDKNKAKEYLQKALTMNPDGIDPNFFYGEILFDEKDYKKSAEYLQKALDAQARPNRELADIGRKKEAKDLLKKILNRF